MRALNPKALALPKVVAMIVLSVVAGASFSLGYIVGKSTATEDCQYEQPSDNAPAEAGQHMPQSAPEQEIITAKSQPAENAVEEKKPAVIEDKAKLAEEAPLKLRPQPVKGKYYVQAGAFNERKVAESLRVRLKAMGFDAYVKDQKSPGGKGIYRVRVGNFADRKVAESMSERLKKEASVKAFVTDAD